MAKLAPRLSIRSKIILPFLLLLVFLGVVGTAVVTNLVTTTSVAQFNGNLLRTSLLETDHLAVLEADRVAQLRTATDTLGVADAIKAGGTDTQRLKDLLVPIQANAQPANLVIRVLDSAGQEITSVPDQAGTALPDTRFAHLDPVRAVLAGRSDAQGDKYVFLQSDASGVMLYWVGPVRTQAHEVVGAILLGESLAEVADNRDSRASELVLYDVTGRVLISSLPAVATLPQDVRRMISDPAPVRFSATLRGRSYAFLASSWTLRQMPLGYLAIALDSGELEASVTRLRLILVLLFVAAALITLLLGSLLAGRITQPIQRLVHSARVVAAGDLSHRASAGPQDEIGQLANAFNDMTASLEEKTRALEETYFASIEALARAIDARDPYTFGHSARVAAISLEMADAMGLTPDQRETLRRGALLHDIGKIGVEDRILRKRGPLTDQEWHAMKAHPSIGHQMLSGLPYLQKSLPAVLHHHERWDGAGYPAGLKEETIPAEVRILCVADTIDAMTSDRPYRKGLSFEVAAQSIRNGAGTQFDPEAVTAFFSRAEAIEAFLEHKGRPAAPRAAETAELKEAA